MWTDPLRRQGFAVKTGYDKGTTKDGPERGVCTSGRGLADASKGVD
jgi:hypothetical protein